MFSCTSLYRNTHINSNILSYNKYLMMNGKKIGRLSYTLVFDAYLKCLCKYHMPIGYTKCYHEFTEFFFCDKIQLGDMNTKSRFDWAQILDTAFFSLPVSTHT